ncbi:histidine--tRNA ligase [Bacteroidota bacterium]|nr:histidine--tRNA ligase [Bacteroidota bacterium]
MAKQKPSIPSGTRDFNPETVAKRRYIFETIRTVFEKYGYQPIETPSFENLSSLNGKYGDEGDQLLFKILNSRLHDSKDKEKIKSDFDKMLEQSFNSENISERALRYDLTVPFARYVVMHQNEITFPFRRYQMQPVWRADRPQKGRYREFWQCDADVIGSDSLILEMELVRIYDEVFSQLKLPVAIHLNNRKILSGIAEAMNATDKFTDITIAIDKFDKVGLQGVRQDLHNKGISESQMQVLEKFFSLTGTEMEKLEKAEALMGDSEIGKLGVGELKNVLNYLSLSGATSSEIKIDFTLARGLNYYTGAIIEVKPITVQMGSLGGGGRYDNLTGMFGLDGMSGVGISFGADRIYDVLEELKLFPEESLKTTQVLFVCFDKRGIEYALPIVQHFRKENISSELYPSAEKLKKQMKYANDKKIPFVIVVGDEEMKSGKLAFKNMNSGEQRILNADEIINELKSK